MKICDFWIIIHHGIGVIRSCGFNIDNILYNSYDDYYVNASMKSFKSAILKICNLDFLKIYLDEEVKYLFHLK